jgi:hypothetical protein
MQTNVFVSDAIVGFKDALDSKCFLILHSLAVAVHMIIPDTPTDPPHNTGVPMSSTHTTHTIVPLEPGLNNPLPDLPTLSPTALGGLDPEAAAEAANGVPKERPKALIE